MRPRTLVGRDVERDALLATLDEVDGGRSQFVLLRGAAGIGKTRLAEELSTIAAARGFTVVWGNGDRSELHRQFGMVARSLGLHSSSHDPARAALGRLLAARPRGETPVFAVGVSELRYRTTEGICDLMEQALIDRPLLLVVDDIQWVDSASRRVIADLTRRLSDQRLLVVATLRDGDDGLATRLEPEPDRGHVVQVSPLDDASILTIASDVLGAPAGDRLAALLSGAGGNPFYALELLGSLRSEGSIDTTDRAELLPAETVVEAMRARLAGLPPEALLCVQVGALLGNEFVLDEVAAVTGLGVARVSAARREAEASGLLIDHAGCHRFTHDLLRQVIDDQIPDAERAALHREAARRFADLGASAARVAHHAAHGAQSGDGAAAEWLLKAAREAGPRAPDDALVLIDEALSATEPGTAAHRAALVDRADVLSWAGRLEDAESQARDALYVVSDRQSRRRLRRHIAMSRFVLGDAADAAAECDASTDEQTDPTMRARTQAEASVAYLMCARMQDARDRATAAVTIGEAHGDVISVCLAEAVLSRVDALDADFGASLERADAAVAAAERDPTGDADRYQPGFFRLLTLLDLDRFDDAEAQLAGERRTAVDRGAAWAVPLHHAAAASTRLLAGAMDDAAAEASAGLLIATDVGSRLASVWLHGVHALCSLAGGELDDASSSVETMREITSSEVVTLGLDLMVLAEGLLLEAQGDLAASAAQLAGGCAVFEATGVSANLRTVGLDAVRLAVAVGDHGTARGLKGSLGALSERTGLTYDRGVALFARGLVDDDPDAVTRGVETLDASPRRFRIARCRIDAGMVLWRHGDRRAAADQLGAALAMAEAAGDARTRETARQLFPALGLRRPTASTRPRFGWEALTPTEVRVVDLATEGRTNPAIAAELDISRRTVESHLSHVYRKLGISSRVELVVRAVRH